MNKYSLIVKYVKCLVFYSTGPEDTLELCHHLMKANLFRSCANLRYQSKDQRPGSIYSNDSDSLSTCNMSMNLSAKDMQALWVLNSTRNASEALSCPINMSSPNIKVIINYVLNEY